MDRLSNSELAHLFEWTDMALNYYQTNDLYRSLKMSIKYATALVKAGEVMPTEVAAVITKEYTSGYGYAIAYEGVLEVGRELGEADAELLGTLMEANKAATKLLWFCKSDNPLHEDDLQPFTLVEDQIVCCLTGDFSEYAQAGSAHTNEGLAVEKLRAKALKLWKANNSNQDDFTSALDDEDDDTAETLYGWVPQNGAIAYLMASGKPAGFGKPDDREQEHPWGWTYGAPETAKVEEPKPAPNAGKVTFSLKKSTAPAAAPAPADKPAEKTDLLTGRFVDVRSHTLKMNVDGKEREFPFELALKQDGVTPIDVVDSDIVVRPPKDKTNKDQVTSWYKEQLGYVPHNWKRRPGIKPKGPTNVVKLADLQASASTPALQTGVKDTATKFVPPPKVVSKETIKHFLEVDYPKILGNNSEFIQNPDKLWAEEEKEPDILAMLNDKRFLTLQSLDLPAFGRHLVLDHIGGPETAFWKTFVSAVWRANILVRRNQEKRLNDQNNTIINMTKEIETLKAATGKATEPTPAVATGTTGKVKFSLKK